MGRPFPGELPPEEPRDTEPDESSGDESPAEGWQEGGDAGPWDDDSWEDSALGRLLHAAETGNAAALAEHLDSLDVPVDTPGPDGDTALHLSCLYGHELCVQALLDAGAAADAADEDGALPLHDAAAGGYARICDMLLADAPGVLNTPDQEGDTPLHNAARGGYEDVVRLLLLHNARPDLRNQEEKTPAQLAERGSAVRSLLEAAEAAAAAGGGGAG